MAPALKVGSVVAVQPLAAESSRVISSPFTAAAADHPPDRSPRDSNNRLLFHTRGDANSALTPIICRQNVGKVSCLPYLVTYSSAGPGGLAILIALASCTALAGPLGQSSSKRKKKRKDNRPVR